MTVATGLEWTGTIDPGNAVPMFARRTALPSATHSIRMTPQAAVSPPETAPAPYFCGRRPRTERALAYRAVREAGGPGLGLRGFAEREKAR